MCDGVLYWLFFYGGPNQCHASDRCLARAADYSPGDRSSYTAGLDSSVPQPPASGAALPDLPPLVVHVLSEATGARYRIGKDDASYSELQPRLRQMLAARPEGSDRAVFLQADRALSFADVAHVAGEAKGAGAETIALLGAEK